MAFFKDTNGRQWRIRLTGPAIAKVREATQITLADPSGQGALAACADGEILTRVLWLLCSDQPPEVTPEQFAEAVASGEVFEAAREALQEALLDFTPPSQRPLLQKVLETERREQQARTQLVEDQLNGEELHDQILQAYRVGLDKQIAMILTRLQNVGNLPEQPESIPTPQP